MSKIQEENEQIRNRKVKVDALRERGYNPYRNDFKPTSTTRDFKAYYHWKPTGELDQHENPIFRCGRPVTNEPGSERFSLAGRIIFLRSFGKAMFVHIRDRTGELQVYISKNDLGDDGFSLFKLAEVGDIIGVSGGGFLTRKGELTLHAYQAMILTKSVRPPPGKMAWAERY